MEGEREERWWVSVGLWVGGWVGGTDLERTFVDGDEAVYAEGVAVLRGHELGGACVGRVGGWVGWVG